MKTHTSAHLSDSKILGENIGRNAVARQQEQRSIKGCTTKVAARRYLDLGFQTVQQTRRALQIALALWGRFHDRIQPKGRLPPLLVPERRRTWRLLFTFNTVWQELVHGQ